MDFDWGPILKSRTRRVKETEQRGRYFVASDDEPGLALGYYRGADSGTWHARLLDTGRKYVNVKIARADDEWAANGVKVLSFAQAMKRAKEWKVERRQQASSAQEPDAITVAQNTLLPTNGKGLNLRGLERTRQSVSASAVSPTSG